MQYVMNKRDHPFSVHSPCGWPAGRTHRYTTHTNHGTLPPRHARTNADACAHRTPPSCAVVALAHKARQRAKPWVIRQLNSTEDERGLVGEVIRQLDSAKDEWGGGNVLALEGRRQRVSPRGVEATC